MKGGSMKKTAINVETAPTNTDRWRTEERLRIILNFREYLTSDINNLIEEDDRPVYRELNDSITKIVNYEIQKLDQMCNV